MLQSMTNSWYMLQQHATQSHNIEKIIEDFKINCYNSRLKVLS